MTDGPYLYRMENGHLLMIWSNFTEGHEYVVAIAHSESGSVLGPWTHGEELLYQKSEKDGLPYEGGHGMLFYTREGQLMLSLHTPNNARVATEHVCLLPVREEENTLVIDRR